LPAGQQFNFIQSLYVLAPTEILHCCIQPLRLGIAGSPTQALN
jgi:hypothetical protein